MDVDQENNVFTEWLKSKRYLLEERIHYLPGKKAAERFEKAFNLDEGYLKTFSNRDASDKKDFIKSALLYAWSRGPDSKYEISEIREEGIVVSNGTFIRYLGTQLDFGENRVVQYINGMILPLEVIMMLKREISNFDQRKTNPFLRNVPQRKFLIIPDIDYLPQLYQELGVKSFEQIPEEVVKLLIPDAGHAGFDLQELTDGRIRLIVNRQTISVMDVYGNDEPYVVHKLFQVYCVNKLPNNVIKEAQTRMKNLTGTMPTKGWSKDVFTSITSGRLKGRDILSLCDSSPDINRFCDEELFTKLILSEFYIKVDHQKALETGFQNVREVYEQMHTQFFATQFIFERDEKEPEEARIIVIKNGDMENVDDIRRQRGRYELAFYVFNEPIPERIGYDRRYLIFRNKTDSSLGFLYIKYGEKRGFYGLTKIQRDYPKDFTKFMSTVQPKIEDFLHRKRSYLGVTLGGIYYEYVIYMYF